MQIVLVHNPASGSALPTKELTGYFESSGIKVIKVVDVTKNPKAQLKPYLNKKQTIIAAYGGDGTLNSVADILVGSSALFAPLPGGTLNHFTKDLGISQDLATAIKNLKKAKKHRVDVASVNDEIFLNNSGIGLYPLMLSARDDMQKKRISKWLAAVMSGIRVFARYRRYKVVVDGKTFKTPFVFVGNNDYGLENQLIGDRKRLDEGILSVYAVSSAKRRDFLKVLGYIIIGRRPSKRHMKLWKTKSITIQARRAKLRVSRDGEHEIMSTPLEYKIISGALNVLF